MILKRKDLTETIRAALAAATGRPVGIHKTPASASAPWAIVYVLSMSTSGPELVAPNVDARCTYQVTSVGLRPDQAQWMSDRIRAAWLDRSAAGDFVTALAAPAGWKVIGRDLDTSGEIDQEGTIYSLPERFTIDLTPV